MKLQTLLLACLVPLGAAAAPLPREQIAADAKWLAHLDVDAFLQSQLGGFITREFLEPKLAKLAKDLKNNFDIDFDWHKIHALTAYGNDFKEPNKAKGVLLVRTDLDVAGALDKVIEKLSAAGANDSPVKKIQEQPFPIYANKEGIVGAPLAKNVFVLSRTREQLEQARHVLTGEKPSLTTSKSFREHTEQPVGFLTVAIADAAEAGAGLPPQARVLKDAQGMQLVAGEKADRIFVNAAVDARDAAVATQLQQALQGVIALAMLSEGSNEEVKQLAQSAKVDSKETTVTIDVQMPVSDVLDKVGKTRKKKRG